MQPAPVCRTAEPGLWIREPDPPGTRVPSAATADLQTHATLLVSPTAWKSTTCRCPRDLGRMSVANRSRSARPCIKRAPSCGRGQRPPPSGPGLPARCGGGWGLQEWAGLRCRGPSPHPAQDQAPQKWRWLWTHARHASRRWGAGPPVVIAPCRLPWHQRPPFQAGPGQAGTGFALLAVPRGRRPPTR